MSTLQVKRMKAQKRFYVFKQNTCGQQPDFPQSFVFPSLSLTSIAQCLSCWWPNIFATLLVFGYNSWILLPIYSFPKPLGLYWQLFSGCLYISFWYFRPWCPVVKIILLLPPNHSCFPAFSPYLWDMLTNNMCISSIILACGTWLLVWLLVFRES